MAAAAPAIPYIMTAVSTALAAKAASDASSERKRTISDMMAIRNQATGEITADIEREAAGYDPIARRAQESEIRGAEEGRLVNDLKAALAAPTKSLPVGRVDPEYRAREAANAAREGERQMNLVRLFSAVQAPSSQRFFESLAGADAAARRNAIRSGARAATGQGGVVLSGITPNAGLTTAAGLIGGAGQAYGQYQSAQAMADAFRAPQTFNTPQMQTQPRVARPAGY